MAYVITEEARSETVSATGIQTTRTFQVSPWSARGEAYADLLGGVNFLGGRLVRTPPLSDPAFPQTRVSEIRCEPVDDDFLDGSVLPAGYNVLLRHAPYSGPARLTVTYKTPENSQDDIDNAAGDGTGEQQEIEFANFAWDFSAQNLTLPNKYFAWKEGAEQDKLLQNQNIAATITIPRFELSLERKLLVRKPTQAIIQNLGKINENVLTIGFDIFPKESLRFDSAQVRQAVTNQGIKFFNITYKFTAMPVFDKINSAGLKGFVGWNRLFNPKDGVWTRVMVKGDPARGIYRLDTEISQTLAGRAVKGFNLLFHPMSF